VDETRLTGLRFISMWATPTSPTVRKKKDRKVLSHARSRRQRPFHDNHGDKDEHLPPYAGTIDWAAP